MEFLDSWLWLIFIIAGLLFILLELIIGVDTGLDLVFIGSVFVIGGLVTWAFHSWQLTVIVTSIISVAYVIVGRRYVHKWTAVRKVRTNIDAIIDKHGIVLRDITRNTDGLVKVGNEQWKARAEEELKKGTEIIVTGVTGVTLIVKKN
ncbi:NfeD family protein [Chloroflexota bacterium]